MLGEAAAGGLRLPVRVSWPCQLSITAHGSFSCGHVAQTIPAKFGAILFSSSSDMGYAPFWLWLRVLRDKTPLTFDHVTWLRL